jgi:hypothetical protein
VCVSGQDGMEWVFLMRLATMLLIPAKWVADAVSTLGPSTLGWSEIIVRWANCGHMVWVWFAYRSMQPVSGRLLILRRILILFSVLYFLIYAAVLYFQPSRQVVLASTVAGLAFALRDVRKKVARHQPLPRPEAWQPSIHHQNDVAAPV